MDVYTIGRDTEDDRTIMLKYVLILILLTFGITVVIESDAGGLVV